MFGDDFCMVRIAHTDTPTVSHALQWNEDVSQFTQYFLRLSGLLPRFKFEVASVTPTLQSIPKLNGCQRTLIARASNASCFDVSLPRDARTGVGRFSRTSARCHSHTARAVARPEYEGSGGRRRQFGRRAKPSNGLTTLS